MFSDAFGSVALGAITGTNQFHGVSGDMVAPLPVGTGEAGFAGYGISGNMAAPAFASDFCYCEVRFAGMSFTGTIGFSDPVGGWSPVVYPSVAKTGDLALLFIAWETTAGAGPELPSGWTLVGSAVGPSSKPIGVLFAQIITSDPDDIFEILVSGERLGGGYIINTYRRATIDIANVTTGTGTTTTTIPMGNIQIDTSGNIAANFVATTGTPSSINNVSVTAPQEVINNVEGATTGGQTSLWALDEIKTLTGSQPQAAVTPNPSGSLSVNWARVSVPLTEIGMWLTISPASFLAPAATGAGTIQLTRHVSGGGTFPLPTQTGAVVVNISGREVCTETGSLNAVVVAGSTNSVVVSPSENSTVSVPIDQNRLC